MESLKTIVNFAVTFANSVDKVLADNKVDFLDIPHIMAPAMQIGPALSAFKAAKDELASATPEQKAELIASLKSKFVLKSERTEEIIEKSFDLVVGIAELVKLVKG
jgi:hypothetical protein